MAANRELGLAMILALSIEGAIASHLGHPHSRKVERQGYGDETFGIDVVAEDVVSRFCSQKKISYISEDAGLVDNNGGGGDFLFLIDPIDGTRNAMMGLPHYACSIAIAHKTKKPSTLRDVYAGLLREMDRKRTFTAIMGKGAWLNYRTRLGPTQQVDRQRLTIATGGHFGAAYVKSARIMSSLMKKMKADFYPRIYNSSAIELAYVAEGSLNIDVDLRPMQREKRCAGVHDIAAAQLIMREAGCPLLLFDKDGHQNPELDPRIKMSIVAACNRSLFREVRDALKV